MLVYKKRKHHQKRTSRIHIHCCKTHRNLKATLFGYKKQRVLIPMKLWNWNQLSQTKWEVELSKYLMNTTQEPKLLKKRFTTCLKRSFNRSVILIRNLNTKRRDLYNVLNSQSKYMMNIEMNWSCRIFEWKN